MDGLGLASLPRVQRAVLVGHSALAQRDLDAWRGRDPDALGRAGLAAARRRRLSHVGEVRPERCEPRLGPVARPPGCGGALPDSDRRMGRLHPPALRRARPVGRQLRIQHYLRPGADRGGQGDTRSAAGREPAPVADRDRGRGRRRRARSAQEHVRPGREFRGARRRADEGFEIVRRRLFQPMVEREAFAAATL